MSGFIKKINCKKSMLPSCGQSNKNHVSCRRNLKRSHTNCGHKYSILIAYKFSKDIISNQMVISVDYHFYRITDCFKKNVVTKNIKPITINK